MLCYVKLFIPLGFGLRCIFLWLFSGLEICRRALWGILVLG